VPKAAALHFSSPANVSSERRRGFEDEADELPFRRLTREEAEALRRRQPSLSPWRVVLMQAALGAVIAAVAWLVTGAWAVAASALYGAAVVVLPALLMARGTTSRVARVSPAAGAVSVMVWSTVKMAASVVLLLLAPKVVQPLDWVALLVALVLCLQVYWLALLWRGRSRN
jgi:ATP synthase protein I